MYIYVVLTLPLQTNLASLQPPVNPPMAHTKAPPSAHVERGRPIPPSSSWNSLKFMRKSSRESLVEERNDATVTRNSSGTLRILYFFLWQHLPFWQESARKQAVCEIWLLCSNLRPQSPKSDRGDSLDTSLSLMMQDAGSQWEFGGSDARLKKLTPQGRTTCFCRGFVFWLLPSYPLFVYVKLRQAGHGADMSFQFDAFSRSDSFAGRALASPLPLRRPHRPRCLLCRNQEQAQAMAIAAPIRTRPTARTAVNLPVAYKPPKHLSRLTRCPLPPSFHPCHQAPRSS